LVYTIESIIYGCLYRNSITITRIYNTDTENKKFTGISMSKTITTTRLQQHQIGWVRLITMIVTTKNTNTTEGQYITNHESRNTTNGFNRFNTGCSSGADYDTKRCNEDEEEKTEAVSENTV